MNLKLTTTIRKGRLPKDFQEAVQANTDQRVELSIKKVKAKRSNPQNSYFHGVVLPMVTNALKDLGHQETQASTKEMLKRKFLTFYVNIEDGIFLEKTLKTSELSKAQFMDFVTEIQQFAVEFLNLQIPDPGQEMELEF